MTGRLFRGGEVDLCPGAVGKIELEVSGFKSFSLGRRSR